MRNILVADDDPVARKILLTALEPLEMSVVCCSDGIHALDVLRCTPHIDLMICDFMMPTLNGRQLVLAINADESLRGLPIILMSGYVGVKEVSDLLESGASRFLPKPLRENSVRDAVTACIDLESAKKSDSAI